MQSAQTLQPSAATGGVRPFREDHIPEVAELHRSVFKTAPSMSSALLDSYAGYLREVFLSHPRQFEDMPALVYEERGKVMGFTGSVPRPMLLRGRPLMARLMSQFVVHPGSRGVAGVKLLQTMLRSELIVSDESTTGARRIWELIGGRTARLHSSLWFYPFRPCQFALSMLRRRTPTASFLARIASPVARSVDWVAARSSQFPYRPAAPKLTGEDLDFEGLLGCLSGDLERTLQPAHDRDSLQWALRRAAAFQGRGELQKIAVRSPKGEIAGWYVYYSNPGGVAEVLQIYSKRATAPHVFDHLLHHAHQRGAAALSGRFEPDFMESYIDRRCLTLPGPWYLVASPDRELTRAFEDGDVVFSRLEGEWCLHFR
jgi:hypothetical protein